MAAARTQPPPVGNGASGQALEGLVVAPVKLAGKGTWEILKRPKALTFVVTLGYSWSTISQDILSSIALSLTGLTCVWYGAHPASFNECGVATVRNLWRRFTIYQPSWCRTMRTLNLHQSIENKPDRYPRLLRVESNEWMDRLLVKPCRGSVIDYRKKAPDIATQFGAGTCRVRKAENPRNLWLELRTGDPLAEPIKPPPPDPNVDLERVQVGVTEDGDPWFLKILGRHLLLAGETGAGKSSLIWAILWAIGPLIRRGLVEVWAVDPKGGMELGKGDDVGLYARYAEDDFESMMQLLMDAKQRMDEHKASARAQGRRKHIPTLQQPYLIVIIDEAAVLKLLSDDTKKAAFLERVQTLILAQGRAPGVTVISALQVPTVATDATRALYPNRVQFRTMEQRHFGMTLAPGVLEYIEPELLDMPGKAFFLNDGTSEPGLGRVFHVEDEDIEWLGSEYGLQEDVERARSVA